MNDTSKSSATFLDRYATPHICFPCEVETISFFLIYNNRAGFTCIIYLLFSYSFETKKYKENQDKKIYFLEILIYYNRAVHSRNWDI